jgi:adenosylcobinamide amidohydrolase
MSIRPRLTPPWLLVDLGYRHRVAGWPVVGPSWGEATTVAWLQVEEHGLENPTDFFWAKARAARIDAEIGLMTAADIKRFNCQAGKNAGMEVTAVVTAGLVNGESVQPSATSAPTAWHPGTVNILLHANVPLTDGAMIEAVSIVAEARTAAILDLGISLLDGRPLTGTGTDCIVVAAPPGAHPLSHCGLHTALGRLIGETTHRAVAGAIKEGI